MKKCLFLAFAALLSTSVHTSESNNASFKAKAIDTIIKYSGPINKYSPMVLYYGYFPTAIAGYFFQLNGRTIVNKCLMGGTLGLSLLYQLNK